MNIFTKFLNIFNKKYWRLETINGEVLYDFVRSQNEVSNYYHKNIDYLFKTRRLKYIFKVDSN
jgi:hypothetical protein